MPSGRARGPPRQRCPAGLQRLGDPLAGTLRIGVIPTISPYLLPEATPLIRRQHPRLTVAWVEEKTADLVGRLGAGELEAALIALESDVGDLEREVVAKDTFVLAVGSDHRLASSASPVAFGALRDSEVLLLDEGHCLRDQALPLCQRAGARESSFRATSLSTLAQMVSGGSGVTVLPRLAVAAESRRGRLKVRPFAKPAPYRTLALVWRRRSPFGAALKALAATLRKAYDRAVAPGTGAAEAATGTGLRRSPRARSPSHPGTGPRRSAGPPDRPRRGSTPGSRAP